MSSSPAVPFTVASASNFNALRAEVNAVAVRAWGSRNTNSGTTTATTQATAKKVMELSAPVTAGHLYRVNLSTLGVYSLASSGGVFIQATYTINGTTPTVTSTRLKSLPWATGLASVGNPFEMTGILPISADATLRVLISFYGYSAGTYEMLANSDAPTEMLIFDMGLNPGDTGTDF